MCLALVMCFTCTIPASAQMNENNDYDVTVMDDNGKTMGMVLEEHNGTYIMKYYYDGELETTYQLNGSNTINAEKSNGERYTLNINNIAAKLETERTVEREPGTF